MRGPVSRARALHTRYGVRSPYLVIPLRRGSGTASAPRTARTLSDTELTTRAAGAPTALLRRFPRTPSTSGRFVVLPSGRISTFVEGRGIQVLRVGLDCVALIAAAVFALVWLSLIHI